MLFSYFSSLIRFLQYGDLPTSYYVRKGMRVGKNFNRQSQTKFDPSHCWLIKIGDNVTISNKVIFLAHDDSARSLTGMSKIGIISVGNNVFIGACSTILPNVRIGNNVIIGAGSLITKDIPDNSVVCGSPAKIISSYELYIDKISKEIKSSNLVYGLDNTIYGKKKMSLDDKRKMYEELESNRGFVDLSSLK